MAGKDGTQKLGKLVETGLSVAKMAQAKAEEALRDVAHLSETQRNQMREIFEDAAKKSRESTELLIKGLRKEMDKQMRAANTLSKEEFSKFSERLSGLSQDLKKMSSVKEEVAKLTEMVNSLMRSMQKQETIEEEKKGEEQPTVAEEKPKAAPAKAPRPRASRAKAPAKDTKSTQVSDVESEEKTSAESPNTETSKGPSEGAPDA